jgi:hypothetical protein
VVVDSRPASGSRLEVAPARRGRGYAAAAV